MSDNKKEKKLIGVSLLGAFASSLCCITPIFALVAGVGGFASAFSWLDPLRPYLMIFTVFVLGFAWFQKLKPKKKIECECETENSAPFIQSKKFLGIVTIFAVIMMAFPYYSNQLFVNKNKENNELITNNLQNLKVEIVGMTCDGCETFIEQTVSSVPGVTFVKANYKTGFVKIAFDSTTTNKFKIGKAINKTSYKVKAYKN